MPCFVGLDVSKKTTNVCILDQAGEIIREGVVETDPKAIVGFLRGDKLRFGRVGVEASDMAGWLQAGLAKAGIPVIAIGTRHAHGVLKNQINKTDRNDAHGIAELMRIGAYRAIHIKSRESANLRAFLTARDALVSKRVDIDTVIRAILRGLGMKLAVGARRTFHHRAAALAAQDEAIRLAVEPLLRVREALMAEIKAMDARVRDLAAADPVCRRLMTAPGIGELGALTFRASVDDPSRFAYSRALGAHFGLTPRTYQSGDKTARRRISRWGDRSVRRVLYLAACVITRTWTRPSWLADWGKRLLERMKFKKAMAAVARKLAVVLHRMWVTETDFRWGPAV